MRVATIDIGTNTVLLLVAERTTSGEICAVAERATITRLGQDVDRTHRLLPEAIARTAACLDEYARVVQALDVERVAVVGTSAMRDAAGDDELGARVRASFGVEAQVLSGAEEARLTFRGALSGLPVERGDRCAVFDIGGGSTEVVMGEMDGLIFQISFAASYDVGSVRLTERFVGHDPITAEEQAAITRAAAEAFCAVPELGTAPLPVGVAGTMTTLAAVSLKLTAYDAALVHGRTMTRHELRRVVEELARLDLASRRSVPGMEPKRADVVVTGGYIALALLDHWGVERIRISDRGVRWGLAEALLNSC
ncbi:MAG: Ppx/GppA family phosphatase [Myxococcota bacterium]|nr:Ppx/GppA family phosphatase [Myxococcota bacterium]